MVETKTNAYISNTTNKDPINKKNSTGFAAAVDFQTVETERIHNAPDMEVSPIYAN